MNTSPISFLATAVFAIASQVAASDSVQQPEPPRLPAFPGAEGYGMFTSGGRGGDVYEVTSLEDAGPGSLRDAVSQPHRTIVFRVSGTIELKSTLLLNQPNITIAGQSSPGGICLKNYALRINARNIVIRYLRVRPGDQGRDRQVDGISMGPRGGADLIFDHCSVSWAIDENFSIYGLPNVTVQWCIISEALRMSQHPKEVHSMGGILSGYDMTMHHNIFISNNDRSPKFNLADWWPGQNTDFRNNVVYNWGARATWGGNGGCTLTNVVNNYYKAGPNSRNKSQFLTLAGGTPGEWYVAGNIVEGEESVDNDNWTGVANAASGPGLNAIKVDRPFSAAPVSTQDAREAYAAVLRDAGANFPERDSADTRVLADVLAGTGRIIDSPTEVGGWPRLESSEAPAVDSDHDGMPDDWEGREGLNPQDANDRNGRLANGYTNLEKYLNSLVSGAQTVVAGVKPAEAFWPYPATGSQGEDLSPVLTWKAGFATQSERIYFGTTAQLGESDLRVQKSYARRIVDKQELTTSIFEPGVLEIGKTYYWRVDEVNDAGVTPGAVWSFIVGAPVAGPVAGSQRVEAESMTLGRAFVENNGSASGRKVTAIPTGTGSLRFSFAMPAGIYRLALCHLDENDGAGQLSIYVNGKMVGSWRSDENRERFVVNATEPLHLEPNDVIKIVGNRHRDELSRIDYLDIINVAAPAL